MKCLVGALGFAAVLSVTLAAQQWPHYAGDQAASHYSPLDQITADNVNTLAIAWEWKPNEKNLPQFGTRPGAFQNTPLVIDGVMYLSTPYNQVAALDSTTGKELWRYDPKAYEDGQPPNGQGFVHRGVVAWRDADRLRIFLNARYKLIQLDAKTGAPVASFGTNGIVDLSDGLVWAINKKHYTNTSPPIVYKDLIIVGNGVGDRLTYKNDPPGDVRAFSAKTGKLVWKFNTIPQRGEFGNNTWDAGSWQFTGHTNVWAPMSLDESRGLVYLPVSTPSNDYYGGRRPGQNLFAESLVCLDANTGKRKWHYQIVHHGLWDYDPASAPNLVTITVDGKRIDAVVQLTKQGWAFVFDRVTGKPVWPIEERAVPRSDVPGEASWPTQPFPSKPPAFESQGVTLDDAFDATPEWKDKAAAELKKFRLGPIYTPPSLQGTVTLPGVWGGANWGGGAFDPATGRLYVKTTRSPGIFKMERFAKSSQPQDRFDEVDAEYVQRSPTSFIDGVPILKPPYAHLVAIDLNRGEIAWKVPFGDAPEVRALPALKGVPLPDRLGAVGPPGAIVTKSGLIFVGGNDLALSAFSTTDGRELWRYVLPRQATATPMTYLDAAGRQVVIIATGRGEDTALVAFRRPIDPKDDQVENDTNPAGDQDIDTAGTDADGQSPTKALGTGIAHPRQKG
ncbi:MAG: pyrroloquinoline quinone-dependent dehydrogenase [Vicinamibacterales bacterium]